MVNGFLFNMYKNYVDSMKHINPYIAHLSNFDLVPETVLNPNFNLSFKYVGQLLVCVRLYGFFMDLFILQHNKLYLARCLCNNYGHLIYDVPFLCISLFTQLS